MLIYFQEKITENLSFIYALQMNREEQIANIFWVDTKMQNVPPTTSWPNEGMSELYLALNSFSQLLLVVFQFDDLSINVIYKEFIYILCSL